MSDPLTPLEVRDHCDALNAWASAIEAISSRVITSQERALVIVAASMRATSQDLRRRAQ